MLIILNNRNGNHKNTVDTIETITSISASRNSNSDTYHIVYVTYNVLGNTYESQLNDYSSNFYEGKTIDIYYDQNDIKKYIIDVSSILENVVDLS